MKPAEKILSLRRRIETRKVHHQERSGLYRELILEVAKQIRRETGFRPRRRKWA